MLNIEFSDEEWRELQSIPDQGYSHRGWLDHRNKKIMQQVRAEALREGLSRGWDEGHRVGVMDGDNASWRGWMTSTPNPYGEEEEPER